MAEIAFFVGLIVVPLLAGVVVGQRAKPWWWAAAVAVVVLVLLAVIPEAEAGEPRLAAGDLLFLLVAALITVALAWVGASLGRRLASRGSPR